MHHRGSPVVRQDGEAGASLVEYALMLALIAVVAYSAVAYFGTNAQSVIERDARCTGTAMDGQADADCLSP